MAVRNCMAKKDTFGRVAKKNNQKSRWFQSVGLGMQYTTVCYEMYVANETALAMILLSSAHIHGLTSDI